VYAALRKQHFLFDCAGKVGVASAKATVADCEGYCKEQLSQGREGK